MFRSEYGNGLSKPASALGVETVPLKQCPAFQWLLADSALHWKDILLIQYFRIQDLLMDLEDIQRVRNDLKFRGAQGTTGVGVTFQ